MYRLNMLLRGLASTLSTWRECRSLDAAAVVLWNSGECELSMMVAASSNKRWAKLRQYTRYDFQPSDVEMCMRGDGSTKSMPVE